jgi:hypothetical protein
MNRNKTTPGQLEALSTSIATPDPTELKQYETRQRRRLAASPPSQPQALDRVTARLKQFGHAHEPRVSTLLEQLVPKEEKPKILSQSISPDLPGFTELITARPQSNKRGRMPKYDGPTSTGDLKITTRTESKEVELPLKIDKPEVTPLSEISFEEVDILVARLRVLMAQCLRYLYMGNPRHGKAVREGQLPALQGGAIKLARKIELHLLNKEPSLLFFWDKLSNALLLCENRDCFRRVSTECGRWLTCPWAASLGDK